MIREVMAGAARGTLATVAMSVPMLVAGQEVMGRQPPKQVTVGMLRRLGLDPGDDGERNAVAVLAHLSFGAGMGSVFSAVRARLDPPGPAVAQGVAFGLAVWALSYNGWIPAVGLLPPPERDRPGRQGMLVVAHVIYGGVLGALER